MAAKERAIGRFKHAEEEAYASMAGEALVQRLQ